MLNSEALSIVLEVFEKYLPEDEASKDEREAHTVVREMQEEEAASEEEYARYFSEKEGPPVTIDYIASAINSLPAAERARVLKLLEEHDR